MSRWEYESRDFRPREGREVSSSSAYKGVDG